MPRPPRKLSVVPSAQLSDTSSGDSTMAEQIREKLAATIASKEQLLAQAQQIAGQIVAHDGAIFAYNELLKVENG